MNINLDLLRSKALFGGLDDRRLEKIVSLLKTENFPKGAIVIKEKQIGDRMYLIAKGNVEVLKYSKEENKNEPSPDVRHGGGLGEQIAMLGEGDSFGEMELIDIQPRTATVKALTDLETVSLSNSDLLKLSQEDLEAFSIILINIARIISRRLRKTDEMLVSIHHP